jgi:hypothetical protein
MVKWLLSLMSRIEYLPALKAPAGDSPWQRHGLPQYDSWAP